MKFRRSELKGPEDLSARAERLSPGEILYEPGKALMKAGAFRILSRRFPLKKLGTFTHYFILDTREPIKDGTVGELEKFGKFFVIREVKPLDRRAIRETGKKYPEAEVTARNIKMDTDTLRKKLGVSSGGNVHIFGLRCDFPSGQENILAVCEKCQNLLDPSKQ